MQESDIFNSIIRPDDVATDATVTYRVEEKAKPKFGVEDGRGGVRSVATGDDDVWEPSEAVGRSGEDVGRERAGRSAENPTTRTKTELFSGDETARTWVCGHNENRRERRTAVERASVVATGCRETGLVWRPDGLPRFGRPSARRTVWWSSGPRRSPAIEDPKIGNNHSVTFRRTRRADEF